MSSNAVLQGADSFVGLAKQGAITMTTNAPREPNKDVKRSWQTPSWRAIPTRDAEMAVGKVNPGGDGAVHS
jgi:hypothetical protein